MHGSAQHAGLTALQARAYRTLHAPGGADKPPPQQLFMPTDDALSLAQAEALELGRMHMHDHNPQAAVTALCGVDHPSARNNLAVALFAIGDVAAALDIAEASWQGEPTNLFALGRVLRWRCWTEGLVRSTDLAAPLRQTKPDCADWPGGPSEWFPAVWLDRMHTLATRSRQSHPDARFGTEFDAGLDLCGAHADYLDRATELGDEITRETTRAVLKRRSLLGDAAAIAALEQGLKHPAGADAERAQVLTWLVGHKLKKPGEPIDIWRAGRLHRSNPTCIEIHDERPLLGAAPRNGTSWPSRRSRRSIAATCRGRWNLRNAGSAHTRSTRRHWCTWPPSRRPCSTQTPRSSPCTARPMPCVRTACSHAVRW